MHNLFAGKAEVYAKYRPEFSQNLYDFLEGKGLIHSQEQQDGLLDLGCGTGQLTIPLSRYFKKVLAVDPSADMLRQAACAADDIKCKNITWLNSYAEKLTMDLDKFSLIAIANAFHWMDDSIVIPWIMRHLLNDGHLLIMRSYDGFWSNNNDWQKILLEIVNKWFRREKQEIVGQLSHDKVSPDVVLKRYPFKSVRTFELPETRVWNVEGLLGFIYSTSFCSKDKLGNNVNEFESEVSSALWSVNSDDRFIENSNLSLVIAS